LGGKPKRGNIYEKHLGLSGTHSPKGKKKNSKRGPTTQTPQMPLSPGEMKRTRKFRKTELSHKPHLRKREKNFGRRPEPKLR